LKGFTALLAGVEVDGELKSIDQNKKFGITKSEIVNNLKNHH